MKNDRLGPLLRATMLLVAALLSGCDGVSQAPDKAVIWIGNDRQPDMYEAQPFAREYLPYALLSARAYDNPGKDGKLPTPSVKLGDLKKDPDVKIDPEVWLQDWYQIEGWVSPTECPKDIGSCLLSEGLGVQLWGRLRPGQRVCDEFVIAFRGTDFDSADDWIANFRWLTRVLPFHDQYNQVQRLMPDIMARMKKEPCYRSSTPVAVTGHSLGGGLAQLAAYSEPRIRRGYVFDPSSVTGFYMVPEAIRDCSRQGLKIDRVYERNEILAYLRFVMKLLYTVDHQNPQIQSVRFNVASQQRSITQHSILILAKAFLNWSGQPQDTVPAKPLPDWQPGAGEKIEQASTKPSSACRPDDNPGVAAG